MGIKGLTGALAAAFGSKWKTWKIPTDVDHVLMDLNSILHDGDSDVELDVISYVCEHLDFIVKKTCIKKTLFIAVDGIPSLSKMVEQRNRRFRREASENKATPGTQFMSQLSAGVTEFIQLQIATCERWRGLSVFWSGAETPGEGEHKMRQYVSHCTSTGVFAPSDSALIVGADNDLILIGLSTCLPKLHMCPSMNRKETFAISELGLSIAQVTAKAMKYSGPLTPQLYRNIITDFCFYCSLFGNDYLPRVASLNFNKTIEHYVRAIMSSTQESGQCTWLIDLETREIQWSVFAEMTKSMAESEADLSYFDDKKKTEPETEIETKIENENKEGEGETDLANTTLDSITLQEVELDENQSTCAISEYLSGLEWSFRATFGGQHKWDFVLKQNKLGWRVLKDLSEAAYTLSTTPQDQDQDKDDDTLPFPTTLQQMSIIFPPSSFTHLPEKIARAILGDSELSEIVHDAKPSLKQKRKVLEFVGKLTTEEYLSPSDMKRLSPKPVILFHHVFNSLHAPHFSDIFDKVGVSNPFENIPKIPKNILKKLAIGEIEKCVVVKKLIGDWLENSAAAAPGSGEIPICPREFLSSGGAAKSWGVYTGPQKEFLGRWILVDHTSTKPKIVGIQTSDFEEIKSTELHDILKHQDSTTYFSLLDCAEKTGGGMSPELFDWIASEYDFLVAKNCSKKYLSFGFRDAKKTQTAYGYCKIATNGQPFYSENAISIISEFVRLFPWVVKFNGAPKFFKMDCPDDPLIPRQEFEGPTCPDPSAPIDYPERLLARMCSKFLSEEQSEFMAFVETQLAKAADWIKDNKPECDQMCRLGSLSLPATKALEKLIEHRSAKLTSIFPPTPHFSRLSQPNEASLIKTKPPFPALDISKIIFPGGGGGRAGAGAGAGVPLRSISNAALLWAGARVVHVGTSSIVPFGIKGTVISSDNNKAQILFDDAFPGGSCLDGCITIPQGFELQISELLIVHPSPLSRQAVTSFNVAKKAGSPSADDTSSKKRKSEENEEEDGEDEPPAKQAKTETKPKSKSKLKK